MGLAMRPAHTGLPTITSLYSSSGLAVSKGFKGFVDSFMASMPLRSQPRRPLRSTPSVNANSSASISLAMVSITRLVFPVRE